MGRHHQNKTYNILIVKLVEFFHLFVEKRLCFLLACQFLLFLLACQFFGFSCVIYNSNVL